MMTNPDAITGRPKLTIDVASSSRSQNRAEGNERLKRNSTSSNTISEPIDRMAKPPASMLLSFVHYLLFTTDTLCLDDL